ncbi:MAG: class I SAM-dependent methyltransferase [Roseibium sp.]|nr:class I SAM-dependent methyltransferase [Roseibium sp.]
MTSDPALETLFLPLERGEVACAPGARVLFSRARAGAPLHPLFEAGLNCEQSFAPDRDALTRAGHDVVAETDASGFDLVLVLPGRQRQEARAQLARAVSKVKPGGVVIAAAANTEGGKTLEADLSALAGPVEKLSKHKCRAVWVRVEEAARDAALVADWAALDAVRPILDGAFVSRPGVFAWDRIDPASVLLIRHLPETLSGKGADLGAGIGVLARAVLERAPKVTALDLYEAEKRALDLAERNLRPSKDGVRLTGIWSDVTKGIEGPYDFIVMNPPFHQGGRADRADVGQGFIRAAARGLRPGGTLYMVANRHLPYEHNLAEVFATHQMLADESGYKVIRAVKAKGR